MAGPYYTTEDASALPSNIADLRAGIESTGTVLHAQRSYTILGTEAAAEIVHVARFPAGVRIIPSMSSLVTENPGTALTVNIGNYTQADTPVVIDVDKYSEDLNAAAGGQFNFYAALANLSAGQNEDATLETAPFWLSMTFVTATTLTADVVLYFNIAYKIEG